ncbi:MAG TPA: hypothetical protein VEK33_23165 [Terriglobales bacterium]|nr:hypothetical protein [Terriglobales bacterium]
MTSRTPPVRYRQIKLSVIGRKTERRISTPVWFVVEDERLYLLYAVIPERT